MSRSTLGSSPDRRAAARPTPRSLAIALALALTAAPQHAAADVAPNAEPALPPDRAGSLSLAVRGGLPLAQAYNHEFSVGLSLGVWPSTWLGLEGWLTGFPLSGGLNSTPLAVQTAATFDGIGALESLDPAIAAGGGLILIPARGVFGPPGLERARGELLLGFGAGGSLAHLEYLRLEAGGEDDRVEAVAEALTLQWPHGYGLLGGRLVGRHGVAFRLDLRLSLGGTRQSTRDRLVPDPDRWSVEREIGPCIDPAATNCRPVLLAGAGLEFAVEFSAWPGQPGAAP